jgi:hypothetical protein
MSPPMTEWESAFAAGLDLYRWETGEYPPDFKAKVLAWYSRHQEVDLHRRDAVEVAANRKNK